MRDELDRLADLDAVLPSQVPHRYAELDQPERRLRLAVLEDAIHTLQQNAHATGRRGRRLHADAFDWIADDDRSEPFSFVNVCEALGFEASCLRRGLLDGRAVAPIRGKGFSLRRAA